MNTASGAALAHQRVVDRETLERLHPLRLLLVLAHRHPRVGVHDVGAVDGVGRPVVMLDARRAEQRQAFELGGVGREARRAGVGHRRRRAGR